MIIEAFAAAYCTVDLLLGATAPTTAFELGAKVDDPMAMYLSDVCTIPSNLAGHPAHQRARSAPGPTASPSASSCSARA